VSNSNEEMRHPSRRELNFGGHGGSSAFGMPPLDLVMNAMNTAQNGHSGHGLGEGPLDKMLLMRPPMFGMPPMKVIKIF